MSNARSLVTYPEQGDDVPAGLRAWERAVQPTTDATQRWAGYYDRLTKHWPNALSPVRSAVVEVDVETGVVEVKKLVVVHDCGRVINPLIVEGQLDGGLVQGMGATLFEHVVYGEDGQPRATTFMDYLLPTAAEVPEIVQVHTESFSERNPLGVKGVGEAGTIAPPAAIANAIVDAVAPLPVQLNELPLSPAVVLAALEAASDRRPTAG